MCFCVYVSTKKKNQAYHVKLIVDKSCSIVFGTVVCHILAKSRNRMWMTCKSDTLSSP